MPRFRFVPRSVGELPTAPFADAEQAWFWFIRCQRARDAGVRFEERLGAVGRPCDPDDIYRAVVGLARRRLIGTEHLKVLGAFGLAGRPPDRRCRDEVRPALLWADALDRLTTVLKAKGIIECGPTGR